MQKKIIQQPVPVVRKVFTTSTGAHHQTQQIQQHHQSNMQLNAVKKINSLLQSGSVSVTGISSGQQRVLQRKPITTTTPSGVLISSSSNNNSFAARQQQPKCYICGENAGLNATILSEASTTTTQTEYVVKLAKVIGPDYSVVLTVEDVICRRCIVLLNQFDKLESELETLRGTLLSFIHKKNNIPDDGPDTSSSSSGLVGSPPPKMPKLQPISSAGSGGTVVTPAGNVTYSIKTIAGQQQQMVDANTSGASTDLNTSATSDVEAQLTSMFEKNSTSPGTTVKQHIVVTTNNGGTATMGESAGGGGMGVNRKGTKLYKCIPCGFKTADLAQFQPHYATCQPRNNAAAAAQQNASSVNAGATTTTTTTTTTGYRCKFCKLLFANIALLKQHNLQEHHVQTHPPQQKTIVTTTSGGVTTGQEHQQQGTTATTTTLYSCTVCNAFKTADKQSYDDHLRKHIKLKPFKCRVCLMRFESREQASIHAKQHQPDYFKCGICNVTFSKRDQLMSHLEVHESAKKNAKQPVQQQQQQQEQQHQHQLQQQQQQQQQTSTSSDSSTQKLLQESIDEALRETIADSIGDSKVIQFHTCNSCSLTFLSEKLYTQHIKTHAHGTTTAPAVVTTGLALQQHQPTHQGQSQQQQQLMLSNSSTTTTGRKSMAGVNNSGAATTAGDGGGGSNSKHLTTSTSTGSSGGGGNASSNTISDGDLESIFERMHSDSKGNDSSTGGGAGGDNGGNSSSSNSMVITNQDGTTGNITFNITLPQQEDGTFVQQQQQQEHQQSVGIDMPTLDQGDDQQQPQKEQQQLQTIPVSMPSLDDDGEQSQNSQNSNTENVPMELEDMQAGEGQQINLILNDGQVLQLDNHILTTDAEGNQILVQGTDSEQIQQLLQSVGVVMQGGEGLGEGETLQMISGDGSGNQMILVQGADGQEQLIDASLLNADGNIVIQQSQEGELNAEGTHITTEDGLQIPVSVAFTTSGEAGHEGQLTVSVADGSEQQLQLHLQQAAHAEGDEQQQQHHDESDEHHHHHQQQQQHQQQGAILTESGQIIIQSKEHDEESARVGEENGSANDSMASDGGGAADDHTNGGDTTLSSGGSNGTITTTTTTAATTGASTNAVSSSGGGGGGGDEQLFNFDELIQPQIVVKQQVK